MSIHSFNYEHGVMVLSNFSSHQIEIWGNTFPTAEHAYQWSKFVDAKIRDKILAARSAYHAWALAQQYRQDETVLDDEFDKDAIMEEVLRAKYDQHDDVRTALLETKKSIIEKHHPTDQYWGTWPTERAVNMQGKIWMKIRDENLYRI